MRYWELLLQKNMKNYEMKSLCIKMLEERGVTLESIAEIVIFLQKRHIPDLELSSCLEAIHSVLQKNEVQHAIMTGISLDILTEQKNIPFTQLQTMLENDEGLYGVDEVMAYGICNLYGSIALTNFGYVDKEKPGIIGTLNEKKEGVCQTFLDDIVGAIAASAASRIAHSGKRLDID